MAIDVSCVAPDYQDLHVIDNGIIRKQELVRSVDLELTHDGTFGRYLASMSSPYDMMNLVDIFVNSLLLQPTFDTNSLHFATMKSVVQNLFLHSNI